MTEEIVPLGGDQASGGSALAGAAPIAMNVVIDSSKAVRMRPGIEEIADLSDQFSSFGDLSIDGLVQSVLGGIFMVAGDESTGSRYVFRANNDGTSLDTTVVDATSQVLGSERPIFAETEALIVIAAGGLPQKIAKPTGTASSRLGGTPPSCTHVIANASRLLANNTASLNRINYSDQAAGSSITGHETWNGFFSADARPDTIVALHENANEVFAFGLTTVQIFSTDSVTTYAPVTTRDRGCIAPYSIAKWEQGFIWLDDRRRFVASDGRNFEDIGKPIKGSLDDMSIVSDAFGYHAVTRNADCYVWTFPTDGRTFVYQAGGAGWSQWAGWDDATAAWSTFPVTAHFQRSDDGDNLVGTADGKLGRLTHSATTDLGSRINAYVQTGFLDRGTSNRKWCKRVTLTIRRGHSANGRFLLSWRDNEGAWEPDHVIELGPIGDYNFTYELRSLGTYRKRQWRFTFSDAADLVLADVSETFEVLPV